MLAIYLLVILNISHAATHEYDNRNRLIATNYENGLTTTYQYDDQGNILQIATVETDTDKDLISDLWEDANGLDKNDPSDAGLDPDGDELTNLEEFQNNTDPNNPDNDGDGVNDLDEATAPNDGDGNYDGTPDKQQKNVVSAQLPNGGYLTYEVSESCDIANATKVESETAYPEDRNYDYPFGVLSFTLPCESASIKIIYHLDEADSSNYVLRKYGAVSPDSTEYDWYTFGNSTIKTDDINGSPIIEVTYNLSDNVLGDDTGDDGVIKDPVGLALFVGGNGSGSVQNIPVFSKWTIPPLVLLLMLFGFFFSRKNREI